MRAEVSNSTNNITIVVPIERLSYCVETLAKGLPREKTFIGASISADEDEKIIDKKLQEQNIEMSLVEGWEKGSEGAKDIANKIVQVAEEKPEAKLQLTYEDEDSIKEKIRKVGGI